MLLQSFEDSDKKPIAVGPWGGQNGTRWDDGVHTTVRQLVIAHGAGIDSIQIEYDNKGGSCWSEKHGGNGGTKFDQVSPYPPKHLVNFSYHAYIYICSFSEA